MKRVVAFMFGLGLVLTSLVPAFADLLSEKTQELQQLRDAIAKQQVLLDRARQRSATLQNQIDILDTQIQMAELQLQALTTEVDKTKADISRINGDLVDGEIRIFEKKIILREAIKASYLRQRVGILEIILGASDLSDLISQLEYITIVENRITSSVAVLRELMVSLKDTKGELEVADKQLNELLAAKRLEQNSLTIQVGAKEAFLADAQLTEAEYQKRLAAAVIEQQRLQREVASLAAGVRKDAFNQGNFSLLWPVPSRRISAGFRASDYLARFKIQHNAIDIPTPQGTPIKAPSDAFVLRVRDGGSGYSFIVLDHGNGMVTVYGHVSSIRVTVGQFVSVGSVIGLTGGTPGTRGAGWLTTGPHLHFEVWLDGQARNPLAYLIG